MHLVYAFTHEYEIRLSEEYWEYGVASHDLDTDFFFSFGSFGGKNWKKIYKVQVSELTSAKHKLRQVYEVIKCLREGKLHISKKLVDYSTVSQW